MPAERDESMSDNDLAAWMQTEHQTLVRLGKLLKEHIAVMPEGNLGGWLGSLREGFGRLAAHLERHFTAKEADGYLEHVIACQPTLARQVEQCRHEHVELARLAKRIEAELAETTPEDRVLVADAVARIQRFLAVVGAHEQRENMITLFAFNQDIGSGE